jgi:PAS domain S-box-containing protein
MNSSQTRNEEKSNLRSRAEWLARTHIEAHIEQLDQLSPEQIKVLVHELDVHQIELELQNEELRRTQVELDAINERYFDLYDLAPVSYFTISESGLILEANLTACSLLGFTRNALIKKPFSHIIYREDQDHYYLLRRQLFSTAKPQACELRIVKDDGSFFWGQLQATLDLKEEDDSICRMVLSDITNSKYQTEIRDLSARLTMIIDQPADFRTCIANLTCTLQQWSGCEAVGIRLRNGDDYPYYETRGFPPEFVQLENQLCVYDSAGTLLRDDEGNPILECMCGNVLQGRFNPESPFFTARGSFWCNSTTALLAGTSQSDRQVRTRNRCNGEGYESVALIPLHTGSQVFGLLQFNDHQTNRFNASQIIHFERIADSLAATLAQRQDAEEKKHLEQQLQQSMKLESIGRLAGGVAHDFNNMLGVILGRAEIALENEHIPADILTDLQEIRKAAERSANLTRQLLTFACRQTVTPIAIELNQSIDAVIVLVQRLIGENNTLAWQPSEDPLWLTKIDPAQVDQILTNLCANARDAIEDCGTITIRTRNITLTRSDCAGHAESRPGDFVILSVCDDGAGLDKETLEHVFEPFFTTKETGKGTGLGMATVYGIVKQNKGFIQLDSKPGQGTTISIYLPRLMQERAETGAANKNKSVPQGCETVLLVEDERTILAMTQRMLTSLGYRVLATDDTAHAIQLATEHADEIQLLMADVIMPAMNGRELADTVQKLCPNISCLFMSGYTADIIAHHGVLDEGIFFIQKPFSKMDLAIKLRNALGTKSS